MFLEKLDTTLLSQISQMEICTWINTNTQTQVSVSMIFLSGLLFPSVQIVKASYSLTLH